MDAADRTFFFRLLPVLVINKRVNLPAGGSSPATHWVNFTADDMETLITGIEAMQNSPEMAADMQNASSFRTVVSETGA